MRLLTILFLPAPPARARIADRSGNNHNDTAGHPAVRQCNPPMRPRHVATDALYASIL